MFDLFRFIMLRPPEEADIRDGIAVANDTELHGKLKQARASDEPLAEMREVAEAFVRSEKFIGQPNAIHHAASLKDLHSALLDNAQADLVQMKTLMRNAFDKPADEVVARSTFQSDKIRVQDSLLAVKLASTVIETNMEHLPLYARLMSLVERTAAGDETLNAKEAVPRALVRFLILPADLFPLPAPPKPRAQETPHPPNSDSALAKRVSDIEGALADLSGMTPDDFAQPVTSPPQQRSEPVADRPPEAHLRGFFTRLFGFEGTSAMRLIAESTGSGPMSGSKLFVLKRESMAQLRPSSKELLRELEVDLTTTPVPIAMRALRSELTQVQQELAAVRASTTPSALLPVNISPAILFPPRLPVVHGHIKPVGMADLLVVKYHLLRYERGEVAYIENILKGESSERSVRRLESTEETTVVETETTKEEERDLQSTERFELQNETENTVSAEGNLKSGNAFSPSYGPMLEFQGGTDSPVSGAQTQASRQASNYSREVTSRSASKVTERIRKQITLRRLREFEEKTLHIFNNTNPGTDNVTGVYQWVEKVLRGQIFNYGRRLMFDIMVPQPAAFVQQAITSGTPAGKGIIKPAEFKLGPEDIHEWNYSSLAAAYGATGIEPPPPLYKIVSKSYAETDPGTQTIAKKDDIPFPGYKIIGYSWITRFARPVSQTNPAVLQILLGTSEATKNESLHGETDSISLNLLGINISHMIAGVDIYLERTEDTYRIWKTKAHSAISQAYQKRLAEYEERLANIQASARIESLGKNPEENRKLIREELKKSAISVFTYQHFDIFGGVELSPEGYVQIKLAEAEVQGPYIRFFEQAFEWEQMIYLFYPYFWGTKFFWMFKMGIDEVDPHFKDFLKAGAARVTVPVRPGFEKAVAHYLETGELWNGSDPLDITSDTYFPIMQEIQARDAVPGTEEPYGDPWEIRLPTTLVSLRGDDKLPRWKEEPEGSGQWVEE